jgi:NSS family neurotransmitter:Na+ symporter
MCLTIYIVAKGVIAGLEKAIRWFMPLLLVLLVVLLGYGINSGGFEQGVDFMFRFDWDALNVDGVLVAMGQAFFTLSLGMGAIMAYGAYVPSNVSITTSVMTIAAVDTIVAIAAGLAIFPIVFANGLEPNQGPGLMFVTLPLAFGQMPLGALFGALFFVLVSFAAITSAISLTEPALAFLVEEYNAKRSRAAISLGVICWVLGLGSVLSFNLLADVHVVGSLTFFDFVDYVSQNLMLPLGGLAIALFAGYVLPKANVRAQLGLKSGAQEFLWNTLIRVVSPLAVLAIFAYTIYKSIG